LSGWLLRRRCGGVFGGGGAVEEDLVERVRFLPGGGEQPAGLVDALHDDAGRLHEVLGRAAGESPWT
jgi:hypothetical protein